MGWIRIPGVEGLVFEPGRGEARKHPCRDCFSCQFCSESRCVECRLQKRRKKCSCGKRASRR